jgi:hypothetical protein
MCNLLPLYRNVRMAQTLKLKTSKRIGPCMKFQEKFALSRGRACVFSSPFSDMHFLQKPSQKVTTFFTSDTCVTVHGYKLLELAKCQ